MRKVTTNKGASKALQYFCSISLLLVLWTLFVNFFSIKPFILPEPASVFSTLLSERTMYLIATTATVKNIILGATSGISTGILVGFLISYSKRLRWIIEPYLTIFQSFPREALFPLFVVWFGFGTATKVINATLLSFLPMALITYSATTNVRKDYIELIQTWGANKFQEFIHCRLPYAVPEIIAGMKVAAPLALIGVVLAEFIGGNVGLGYIIISSGSTFDINRLFGAVVILACLGLFIVFIINTIKDAMFLNYYYNK